MSETMNIYAAPGSKVVYANTNNGYTTCQNQANKFLTPNEVYTVNYTIISSWSSLVHLVEVPGEAFNTVLFADFVDTPADDNIQEDASLNDFFKDFFKCKLEDFDVNRPFKHMSAADEYVMAKLANVDSIFKMIFNCDVKNFNIVDPYKHMKK